LKKDSNARVTDLIKGRLELGQQKYNQSIPIRGEGGRDNLKESLEEVLDLAVYLSATILELQDQREAENQRKKQNLGSNLYRVDVQDIRLILKGLHYLQEEAYKENQLQSSKDILDLINGIKSSCKWDHEDDKGIRQNDNPMHEFQDKNAKQPYTKCIEGSNCE